MPDDNYTISSLTALSTINNGDLIEISTEDQTSETGYASGKVTMTQLADKLLKGIQFATDLDTENKTIIGAINELKVMVGTTAPTAAQGVDGNLYIQYTAGTGGADDVIDGLYIKLDGAWCEISTGGGGSGGHTILDDGGTALTQRANLQFKGAYSEDNSGDDTTEVNVVRSMTKAQYNQLSSAEKVGIINVTDEKVTATDLPISGNDPTDTKNYIDSKTADSGWLDMSLSSGVSNITGKKSQYRTIGNVLYFNIQAEFTNDPSWGTNIGWLGRCKYESTFAGRYGNGICTITISGAGNVAFLATTNTSSTDKRLIISGSYVFES